MRDYDSVLLLSPWHTDCTLSHSLLVRLETCYFHYLYLSAIRLFKALTAGTLFALSSPQVSTMPGALPDPDKCLLNEPISCIVDGIEPPGMRGLNLIRRTQVYCL